jgi:hypothetical protein
LVYSLTDYRLKQKRHDYLDLPTAHPPNSIKTSSTTLNSTTSISTDDNTQENKRLTSKWLINDEISVKQKNNIFQNFVFPVNFSV